MAQIILEFCPCCLRPVQYQWVSGHVLDMSCNGCRNETPFQAADEYARRLASARVWYTVPETYKVKEG